MRLGCPTCFPNRVQKLAGDLTAVQLYDRTQTRAAVLRARGYHLIEQWECEFNNQLKDDANLRSVYNSEACYVPPPLNPREHCLRGGRTEAFQLHHRVEGDEFLEHYDIVCFNIL